MQHVVGNRSAKLSACGALFFFRRGAVRCGGVGCDGGCVGVAPLSSLAGSEGQGGAATHSEAGSGRAWGAGGTLSARMILLLCHVCGGFIM